MTVYRPIALFVPQFVDGNGDPYSGAVLKAYQDGTSTTINMYTDNTGGTSAATIALNASGYPEVSGSVVIPHVDQDFKLALYPTQAAADSDTGAVWTIDQIDLTGVTTTGTETLTNKTLTSPTINTPTVSGGTFTGNPDITTNLSPSGYQKTWPLMSSGGVNADGASDYFDGFAMTGITDTKTFTFACLVRFNGAAAAVERICSNSGAQFTVYRTAAGDILCSAENSSGTEILRLVTLNTPCSAAGTYAILISANLNTAGSGRIYVNDVGDVNETVFTNDTIDFTVSDWTVCAANSGSAKMTGDLYFIYLDETQALDFDTESNRRKFFDREDVHVYCGETGEIPSGSQPAFCLDLDTGSGFLTNKGSATGTFTVNGASNVPSTTNYMQYAVRVIDEDNMASDSALRPPSQQSAKAYVDKQAEVLVLTVGDETTALTTGTAKKTFRMPFAMTLTAVRASVTTAPTGATVTVDINEGGTTILSTKLTIDAGETTSTTAATPAVISDTALADDAEITIDIDQIGSGTAGAGLKVTLIGTRT